MSERILRRVEQLAEELYGKAAAVSVDAEDDWKIARVWNDKGTETLEEVQVTSTKTAALTALRELLLSKLGERSRAPVPRPRRRSGIQSHGPHK